MFLSFDQTNRIRIVRGEELEHLLWHLREAGIEAVMQLQGAIGIHETYASAAAGWDRMGWPERHKTMLACAMIFSPGDHVLVDPKVITHRFGS